MFTLCSKCVDPWRSKLHCSRVAESKSRRENKLTKPPPSSFFLLLLLPFFYSAGRAIYIKQDPILAAAVGGQPVRESPCSPPALFLVTGQLQTATLSYFCPYTFSLHPLLLQHQPNAVCVLMEAGKMPFMAGVVRVCVHTSGYFKVVVVECSCIPYMYTCSLGIREFPQ